MTWAAMKRGPAIASSQTRTLGVEEVIDGGGEGGGRRDGSGWGEDFQCSL